MSAIQSALLHPTGPYTAVVVFERAADAAVSDLRPRLAALMHAAANEELVHDGLQILLAVRPQLVADSIDSPLPDYLVPASMATTQVDALVQISADSRRDLLIGLRTATLTLAPAFVVRDEYSGGDFMLGQEPWGFYHRNEVPFRPDRLTGIKHGNERGGGWMLYQRYEYDLEAFMQMSPDERFAVVGAPFSRADVTTSVEPAPANAHTQVMASSPDANRMLRRGTPYRWQGQEGLAFIGVAVDPEVFRRMLQLMNDFPDALLSHATAVEGNRLFVPPADPQWMSPGSEAEPLPAAVQAMMISLNGDPLTLADYTVGTGLIEFIDGLRDVVFENDDVNPDAQALIEALIDVAAGGQLIDEPRVRAGNGRKRRDITAAYTRAVEQALRLNEVAGRYMTLT